KDTAAGPSVTFAMRDPDGANGYPGQVDVKVTYTLTHRNALKIQYEAHTTKATPINLTNHAYFNLLDAGATPIGGHVLQVMADRYTPVNKVQIPTGALAPVAGTPIDFRRPKPIGNDLAEMDKDPSGKNPSGYDHNLVLRKGSRFEKSVMVTEPQSGRTMEMWTDQPGVQLYTGNFLDGKTTGRGGAVYGQYHAFCLEAQHYPDSPNRRTFPSTILRPGGVYHQTTEYRFGVTK
ncbi:galactose mutarotase, partial [bacterium]